MNKDHHELLLFTIQEMMRETLKYYQYRYRGAGTLPAEIEMSIDEFESKAKDLSLSQEVLISFYSSSAFSRAGFRLNQAKGLISINTPLSSDQ